MVNITCPELKNHTFTNEAPFDILGLPECGFSVELPELKLYLDDENKTECFLDPTYLPNENTTSCFSLLKNSVENGKTKKLMLITHGFLNSFDTNWLHTMKDAIQEVDDGTAVIVSVILKVVSF